MRPSLPLLLALLLAACGEGVEPPAASVTDFSTAEDVSFEGDLGVADPEGLTLTVPPAPKLGTVVPLAGGRFRYTPFREWAGTERFPLVLRRGEAEATVTVQVTVTPVNDLPHVTLQAPLPQVDEGTRASLRLQVADPDGPRVTLTLEEVRGPVVGEARLQEGVLELTAGAVERVTPVLLRVRAEDGAGGVSRAELSVGVRPVSADGRLRTLNGGLQEEGYHVVFVGDGFTEADLPRYRAYVERAVYAILSASPLQAVNATWNIHALDVVSAESGIDDTAKGIQRDTALGTGLNCTASTQLLCGVRAKQEAASSGAVPQWDLSILIAHADQMAGVGSTGGTRGLAAVTTNGIFEAVLLHELGHSHADLGDEYFYSTTQGPPPPSVAGVWRNISLTPDRAQVPWRHWLDVPGVGVFEGGATFPKGVWRPTEASFMRNMGARIDPVSAEGWALQTYARAGAILTETPAAGAVTAPAGAPLQLAVQTLFPGAEQEVRWWVDGVEQAPGREAREARTLTLCTDGAGEHAVTVQASDRTGLIRLPPPGPHVAERRWTVRCAP